MIANIAYLLIVSWQLLFLAHAEAGVSPGQGGAAGAQTKPIQTWEQELGLAGVSEDVDPLIRIAELMKAAQIRLLRKEVGPELEELQASILGEFDKLLSQGDSQASRAMAQGPQPSEHTQSQERRPSEQTANTQAKPSGTVGQEKKSGTAAPSSQQTDLKELLPKIWGELPDRDRAALLQQPAEAIVPKYRSFIEAYYRELLDQNRRAAGN